MPLLTTPSTVPASSGTDLSTADASADTTRHPYETPRVVRRQSLARVTLFSGGGTSTVGLVTSG